MKRIDVLDLIGKPWAGGGRGPDAFDCFGVVAEVLSRMGRICPPVPSERYEYPIDAVEAFGSAWDCIGLRPLDANRLGDVVVTDPAGTGCSVHLSVVVDESPRRLLTAVKRSGVTRSPMISEAETVGAYRLRERTPRVER